MKLTQAERNLLETLLIKELDACKDDDDRAEMLDNFLQKVEKYVVHKQYGSM